MASSPTLSGPAAPDRPATPPAGRPRGPSYSLSPGGNVALLPLTDSYIRSMPLLLPAHQEYT